MSVTAIVVARAGSVRLPGKALLPFAGRTLLGHKVATLRRCPSVTRVVVGSDCPKILAEGERYGADAIRRDAYHCDESRCTANEMIRDMAEKVGGSDGDVILWAHPTNPLVRAETYEAALRAYTAVTAFGYDSLMSVTCVRRHAWDGGHPLNYDPWTGPHPPASMLPEIRFQDGAIFIQPRRQMLVNGYFFGRCPQLFPVAAWEGTDVDCREDYLVACAIQAAPPCV